MTKKGLNKGFSIAIAGSILLIIAIVSAVLLGSGTVIGGQEIVDTGISCVDDTSCQSNPELEEIESIVFCDGTCKFRDNVIDGVFLNE